MYDRNRFERDTALGAWERRWVVLSQWFVRDIAGICFAAIPFA